MTLAPSSRCFTCKMNNDNAQNSPKLMPLFWLGLRIDTFGTLDNIQCVSIRWCTHGTETSKYGYFWWVLSQIQSGSRCSRAHPSLLARWWPQWQTKGFRTIVHKPIGDITMGLSTIYNTVCGKMAHCPTSSLFLRMTHLSSGFWTPSC